MKLANISFQLLTALAGIAVMTPANAITQCATKTGTLGGAPTPISCSGAPAASGVFSGDQGDDVVRANLSAGAQLDVTGINQNGILLVLGCAARDKTTNGAPVTSAAVCIADSPGEQFVGTRAFLFR